MKKSMKVLTTCVALTAGVVGGVVGGVALERQFVGGGNNSIVIKQKDNEIKQMAEKITNIENELKTVHEECTGLKTNKATLENRVQTLETENSKKQDLIDEKIAEIERQKIEGEEKDGSIAELQREVQQLTEEKTANEKSIETMQNQIITLNTIIKEKEETISNVQSALTTIQSQFNALQASYETLQTEDANKQETINSMLGQMAVLNAKLDSFDKYFAGDYIDLSELKLEDVYSIKKLSNGNLLISYNSKDSGISYYNYTTKQLVNKWELNQSYEIFKVDDGAFTSGYSILYFNNDTESIVLVHDGYDIRINSAISVKDGYILLTNKGVYYYDKISRDFIQKSTIDYTEYKTVTDGVLLYNSRTVSSGISFFEPITKNVVQKYSEGSHWSNPCETSTGYLFSSSSSSTLGVLEYKNETKQVSLIISEGYSYEFRKLNNGVLCGSKNVEEKIFYVKPNEIKEVTSGFFDFYGFIDIGEQSLIAGDVVSNIQFKFNEANESLEMLRISGLKKDCYLEFGDYLFVFSISKESKIKVYDKDYNYISETNYSVQVSQIMLLDKDFLFIDSFSNSFCKFSLETRIITYLSVGGLKNPKIVDEGNKIVCYAEDLGYEYDKTTEECYLKYDKTLIK